MYSCLIYATSIIYIVCMYMFYIYISQDERFNKAIDMQTGFKTKSILCMPVNNNQSEVRVKMYLQFPSTPSKIRRSSVILDN